MVGEEISIQHEENLVNMEMEEGYWANDDVNEEKFIEDGEIGMRDAWVTE